MASVRSMLGPLRKIGVGAALILPALIYLILAAVTPPQYRFVLEDASDRGWPFAYAILILVTYSVCAFWALRARDLLTPLFAVLASATLAAALVTGLLVGGSSLATVASAAVATILLVLIFWLLRSPTMWGRLPEPMRSASLALAVALAIYLAFGLASSLDPVRLPRALGSFAILAIFAGTLGIVACIAALRPKAGAVVFGYCLLAVLLFGPNDHGIPTTQARQPAIDLSEALRSWVQHRRDLDAYRASRLPYPVIFVSSEGGGIYAAAHAYGALSRLARHCPTFSQHVFATVGVSGGALGNALFAGAVDPAQKPYAPCGPVAGETTEIDATPVITDHLSPVLARFLLIEPVDMLMPGRWMERDRAQILTDSFLSVARGRDQMAAAITDSFDIRSARPALVSVAVDVANGTRLVMSPFQESDAGGTARWWPGGDGIGIVEGAETQISVLNAAGVSARFPWITPTGRLRASDDEDLILADGGYFENSGADTVLDLINAIRYNDNRNRYRSQFSEADGAEPDTNADCTSPSITLVRNFHEEVDWESCTVPLFIIHLALASRESGRSRPEVAARPVQSFLVDPLSALLATRGSRGEIALQRAELDQCGVAVFLFDCLTNPESSLGFFRNDIEPLEWNLPLGWYMPKRSFDTMLARAMPVWIFDYRRHRRVADTDTELLIFHFDLDLYREDASISFEELMPDP